MRTEELLLYRHMEHGDILFEMSSLMQDYKDPTWEMEGLRSTFYECWKWLPVMALRAISGTIT